MQLYSGLALRNAKQWNSRSHCLALFVGDGSRSEPEGRIGIAPFWDRVSAADVPTPPTVLIMIDQTAHQ